MRVLSFNMTYADKKWPEYLEEVFGKETAEKCKIEARATASSHEAKIELLNFNGSPKILKILRNNDHVISAYSVDKHVVKDVLKA